MISTLIDCVNERRLDTLRTLIGGGADPTAIIASDKGTLLHLACENGYEDVAKVLLDAGADPRAEDENQGTPLHCACSNSEEGPVQLLIAYGADHRVKDNEGETPLHWAAYFWHEDSIRALLCSGADPNVQNEKGITPFYYASNIDSEELIRALLCAGADCRIADQEGVTPLTIASRLGRDRIFRHMFEWAFWIEDGGVELLRTKYGVTDCPRHIREQAVEVRRTRYVLRPLVDPRKKDIRDARYGASLLSVLPWHLRVDVLRFVTWRPVRPSWGKEEFEC